jgi:hypothetical protein
VSALGVGDESGGAVGPAEGSAFAAMGARRLLVLGGIGLILTGMIFGDIFAIFTLHQNAGRVGASLAAAAYGAAAGDAATARANFRDVGAWLENRGTKVDTHVHMIDFGYLALLLALIQPWVGLREPTKRGMAWTFLVGAWVLPVGVFLIQYVGLWRSPLQAIGWASIAADSGGLLVLLATAGMLVGLCVRHRRDEQPTDTLLADRSVCGRMLFGGGVLLVLLGMAHGAYYAGVHLYEHEARDYGILAKMARGSASGERMTVDQALAEYGQLQGDKAVSIAAHAHAIEFGLLAMMLAFFQPYVSLREKWKRRWAAVLLAGSLVLPVCVLLEMKYGLVAGGLADFGGVMVILALLAMWMGILRYSGALDMAGGETV